MMQIIGILLALNSIVIAFWLITTGQQQKGSLLLVCALAVFFGIFLIVKDRIIEITIKGVGTIKTASEKAVLDAKQIEGIKERMESQSVIVELVAKEAKETKELSEELANKNEIAGKKLEDIDKTVQKASDTLTELEAILEFTATVTDAQNDDRQAFDKLKAWAEDKTYQFSQRAQRAWKTILDEHASGMYESGFSIPWRKGIDPSKLTLQNLKQNYDKEAIYLRPAFIEYIWKREDFSKKERMQFLIDVIKNDQSLKAVEYAGRYFAMAADLKIKPLAVEHFTKWWDENKDKIEEKQ